MRRYLFGAIVGGVLLFATSGCSVRFPDEEPPGPSSPEEFFVSCMASQGFEVFDVHIGPTEAGFGADGDPPGFDATADRCMEEAQSRFFGR